MSKQQIIEELKTLGVEPDEKLHWKNLQQQLNQVKADNPFKKDPKDSVEEEQEKKEKAVQDRLKTSKDKCLQLAEELRDLTHQLHEDRRLEFASHIRMRTVNRIISSKVIPMLMK